MISTAASTSICRRFRVAEITDQMNAPAPTRAVTNAARPVGEDQPDAAARVPAARVVLPAMRVTAGTSWPPPLPVDCFGVTRLDRQRCTRTDQSYSLISTKMPLSNQYSEVVDPSAHVADPRPLKL